MSQTIKGMKALIAREVPRHEIVWKLESTCAWGKAWHGWCKGCHSYFVLFPKDVWPIQGPLVKRGGFSPALEKKCWGADLRDKIKNKAARKRAILRKKYESGGIDEVIKYVVGE